MTITLIVTFYLTKQWSISHSSTRMKRKNNVLMLVLQVQEISLYQRFFLDAGIGFWEEWNEEDTFSDLEDLEQVDLVKEFNLQGNKVFSIECKGSHEELSTIEFVFNEVALLLKFSEISNIESDVVLERL